MKKFKKGDRVRIKTDSTRAGTGLADGWQDEGAFAGRTGYVGDIDATRCSVFPTIDNAYVDDMREYLGRHDYGDLELITQQEGGAIMARRTFRQVKETVDSKKGTLWQEQCDDGTQPYIVLTPELIKGNNANICYRDRSLVEEQPAWFVEVFPVEPAYMTTDELERWHAFQSVKAPKAAAKPRAKRAAKDSSTKMERLAKAAKA